MRPVQRGAMREERVVPSMMAVSGLFVQDEDLLAPIS
jgi:hypothetical protein